MCFDEVQSRPPGQTQSKHEENDSEWDLSPLQNPKSTRQTLSSHPHPHTHQKYLVNKDQIYKSNSQSGAHSRLSL